MFYGEIQLGLILLISFNSSGMPSALLSTSMASFYEARLPSEALLGPSEDCTTILVPPFLIPISQFLFFLGINF